MNNGLEHNPLITEAALAAEHAALFGWALTRCGHDRAMAEDLVQQCYLMVLDGSARFDGRARLRTWLFGVVQNLARNAARSSARRFGLGLRLVAAAQPEPAHAGVNHGNEPGPGGCSSALSRAIQALPARQRDVVELHTWRDLSLEETATVLGISVGSTRTHWHRAKQNLRQQLTPGDGQQPEPQDTGS